MALAVLCPGQGAQHPAMLDLALSHPAGRRALDDGSAALGTDVREWLDADAMFANANAQPLICLAQNAQWRALRDDLPRPRALAGYSVGELSGYGVADAVDVATLAVLARQRAMAMDAAAVASPGGMIGIRGIPRRSLEALCAEAGAHVAIATTDDAFVVGASEAGLAALAARCERRGIETRSLHVGVAAHTPLLQAAVLPFKAALDASPLCDPAFPVVAGIDATTVTTRERAIATLAPQIARTIEWSQCLDALVERGCRVFLELGPGQALSRMVRERCEEAEARAVDEFRSLAAVAAWVARKLAQGAGP